MMKQPHSERRRERGSAFLVTLGLMLVLMGFVSLLTVTSATGLKATNVTERSMRSFYLADAGAQVAIAKVRGSDGACGAQDFTESIAGGSCTVNITEPSSDLFRILSTGTFADISRQVEVYIQFVGAFGFEGAVSFSASSSTHWDAANIPIHVDAGTTISGAVHDASGALASDQSGATYGLASAALPDGEDFAVTGTGTVNGSPSPTDNATTNRLADIAAIWTYAKSHADISVVGSKTLGASATGSYGTAASPKLTYVKLGSENLLTMDSTFSGYGTLVIEVNWSEQKKQLLMRDTAEWNGPVILYYREQVEIQGGTLVELQGSAKIVGALAFGFNTAAEHVQSDSAGTLVNLLGTSSVLYSPDLISTAPGTSVAAEKTASVLSYRFP